MNSSELKTLSIKQLKENAKAFGISTAAVFEKDDLIALLSSTTISKNHMVIFRMNRSAAAALKTSRTSESFTNNPNHNSTPNNNSASNYNTNQSVKDPIAGLFHDIGKGFQEMSTAFRGVGEVLKEVISPNPKNASENPMFSNETSGFHQQPQSSSSRQPRSNPSSGASYSQHIPLAPSSTTHSTSPSNPLASDVDPPSITTLATTNLDLNTLSSKALKRILLRERVSTLDINDREELLRRTKVLVDNVSKELDTSHEDNLCKVCCER